MRKSRNVSTLFNTSAKVTTEESFRKYPDFCLNIYITNSPIENKCTEYVRIYLYLIRNKFLDTE